MEDEIEKGRDEGKEDESEWDDFDKEVAAEEEAELSGRELMAMANNLTEVTTKMDRPWIDWGPVIRDGTRMLLDVDEWVRDPGNLGFALLLAVGSGIIMGK